MPSAAFSLSSFHSRYGPSLPSENVIVPVPSLYTSSSDSTLPSSLNTTSFFTQSEYVNTWLSASYVPLIVHSLCSDALLLHVTVAFAPFSSSVASIWIDALSLAYVPTKFMIGFWPSSASGAGAGSSFLQAVNARASARAIISANILVYFFISDLPSVQKCTVKQIIPLRNYT